MVDWRGAAQPFRNLVGGWWDGAWDASDAATTKVASAVHRYRMPTREELTPSPRAVAALPLISVVMPIYEPPRHLLRASIESVLQQTYPKWELCLADDASPSEWIAPYLAELAETDPRIRVVLRTTNGHISEASNSAISIASGEWLALLDNDDVILPHALLAIALAAAREPDATVIYSDEEKLDERGERLHPYRKPDWNPDLILAQNFVSHLGAYRREIVTSAGGFRQGFEGSQDHDLLLRCMDWPDAKIVHIPYSLYLWRLSPTSVAGGVSAKPYAVEAGIRGVADHLRRQATPARVEAFSQLGYRICPPTDAQRPSIGVVTIEPTSDGLRVNREISKMSDVFDTILLLQSDIVQEASAEWLPLIEYHLSRPGVGAVGGRILDSRGRVADGALSAGQGHGFSRPVRPLFEGMSKDSAGGDGRPLLLQTVTALSMAFVAFRRSTWTKVGGFSVEYSAFADVDFAMRLVRVGLRSTWLPEMTATASSIRQRPFGAESRRLLREWPELRHRDRNLPTALASRSSGSRESIFKEPSGARVLAESLSEFESGRA